MRDERGTNEMDEVNEVNEIIRLRTTYGVRGLIYGELGFRRKVHSETSVLRYLRLDTYFVRRER